MREARIEESSRVFWRTKTTANEDVGRGLGQRQRPREFPGVLARD